MTVLRVYEVASSEFWAGRGTPESIQRVYLQSRPEVAACDDGVLPRALSESELDSLCLTYDLDGHPTPPQTFREHLAELVLRKAFFPCFFASLLPPGTQYDQSSSR